MGPAVPTARASAPARALHAEFLIDGGLLGLFMVSACGFGTLLEASGSPLREAIADPLARRALMGVLMGMTAIALIYSPWGRRSGAHMNPAVTLAFVRLGRMPLPTALFYMAAQFAGAALAVAFMARGLGMPLTDAPVQYVQTLPGPAGDGWAFAAEAAISLVMMTVVLESSARRRLAPWTGALAGALVAVWITIEAPVSGMSMNPARTFGSAFAAGHFEPFWIYALAPPLGMLLAAEFHARRRRPRAPDDPPACIKLCHDGPCAFCDARDRDSGLREI